MTKVQSQPTSETERQARELLALEYERGSGDGAYPTYAQLARSGCGGFTICQIRAVEAALNSHATLKARITELESNEAAYESIIGKRTYNEVAEHIRGLEEALETAESEARRYAEMYQQSSDGRNTFIILADRIAALSHAGRLLGMENRSEPTI